MSQLGRRELIGRLPDFLIIGAMKAGTTTLHQDLKAVEGVFMPVVKEPACLVSDSVLTPRGKKRYAHHYEGCPSGGHRAGDASTHYSKLPDYPGVPDRARRILGDEIQILYVVRDPVRRLVSQHKHLYYRGKLPRDIAAAIDHYPSLVDYSRYRMQLEPWLSTFGADQVKIIAFERYVRNRQSVLAEVLRFLDVAHPADELDLNAVHNEAGARMRAGSPADQLATSTAYLQRIRPLVPGVFRRTARRLTTLRLPPPTELSARTEQNLRDLLRPDTEWLESIGIELGDL